MNTRTGRALIASVMVLGLLIGPSLVLAAFHGAGASKETTSPVNVGDPYQSRTIFSNTVDTGHDTLRVTGLSDVVHSAGGNVSSGQILSTTGLIFSDAGTDPAVGTVTCTGGTGAGTVADPRIGATSCLLTYDALITTAFFSHYTVQAADYGLPNHQLPDTVTWDWNNTCTFDPDDDCSTDAQTQTAGASAFVLLLASQTATQIHNAAHQVVTAVAIGSTVHDFVAVTGQVGAPVPTGNVTIDWFLNGTCTGTPAATSAPIALGAGGTVDATAFAFTVNTAGTRAFLAHYAGDAIYSPSDGPCEPLQVLTARISITPNDTNEIGNSHTFTATVWVNDGSGETLAPAGTVVTFTSVDSGSTSTPNPPTQCLTVAATGSCTTTINSATPGSTTVTAHTTLTVAGVVLTRDTNNQAGNSGPATKTWVDARISITPNDTNEVGNSHIFTATVWVNNGSGETLAPAGTVVTFTSVNSNGATSTPNPPTQCLTVGVTGSCTTTINSSTPGTTTVTAHTVVTVGGVPLTRSTNSTGANSSPAAKTWVDARISITPNDVNEVGNSHTFTATVWVNNGSGETLAPNGTVVTFTSVDSDGAVSTPNPPAQCTTTGGTCITVINSNSTGSTTVTAHTTVTVGGVPLTRHTNSTAANSGPATKTWVDASIGIVPNGNNPVNSAHTFTVTVMKDAGGAAGLVAAAGETVTTSIVNSLGATATMVGGTCGNTTGGTGTGTTNASGQCTVVISSPTAGTTTAFAAVTLTVNGVPLTRDSDSGTATVHGPGGTDQAVKTWFTVATPTPTLPDTAAASPEAITGGNTPSGNLILFLILGTAVAAALLIRPGLRSRLVASTDPRRRKNLP